MSDIPPLAPNPAALDFLLTRRSRPPKLLAGPGPDRETLQTILTAGLRAPDHGKLEPWRLVVVAGPARARMADLVEARGAVNGVDPQSAKKSADAWRDGAVSVVVVKTPRPTEKIPDWEQLLSGGAVCLSLVNACLAAGWGASWLTGYAASDPEAMAALGLQPGESVLGFIQIGAERAAPPERPRPDVAARTTWLEA